MADRAMLAKICLSPHLQSSQSLSWVALPRDLLDRELLLLPPSWLCATTSMFSIGPSIFRGRITPTSWDAVCNCATVTRLCDSDTREKIHAQTSFPPQPTRLQPEHRLWPVHHQTGRNHTFSSPLSANHFSGDLDQNNPNNRLLGPSTPH